MSRFIALALDDLVRIPGTGIGIGLDGVLGLIPGVGDAGTTAVAALLMADAIRNRVPLPVLARMGLNLGLDALIGMIQVIGDIGDFAHRANRRNLRLLQRAVANREQTRAASVIYLGVALGMVVTTVAVLLAVTLWSLWVLWRLVVPH